VVETSVADFQRSGGWNQLYAVLGLPRWMPRPGMAAGARAILTLRGAVGRLLEDRRCARAAGASVPDDLLTRLMAARDPESGQAMDEERLVDNLLTFYLAGHETTAKALTWTLYLLARSAQWHEAVRAEVEEVTGGAPLEARHVEHLPLTQQVIKESMRLFPPVPMMSRQAVAAARLGEHVLAPGDTVILPIYAIHRHLRRWERPAEFDPLRFAPGREGAIERFQYMPFGAGPRICIGMAFAMIESTAILATLVRGARFAPTPGLAPVPVARVTLLPRGGMPLAVSAG
jgi:cytochrome P450